MCIRGVLETAPALRVPVILFTGRTKMTNFAVLASLVGLAAARSMDQVKLTHVFFVFFGGYSRNTYLIRVECGTLGMPPSVPINLHWQASSSREDMFDPKI